MALGSGEGKGACKPQQKAVFRSAPPRDLLQGAMDRSYTKPRSAHAKACSEGRELDSHGSILEPSLDRKTCSPLWPALVVLWVSASGFFVGFTEPRVVQYSFLANQNPFPGLVRDDAVLSFPIHKALVGRSMWPSPDQSAQFNPSGHSVWSKMDI